MLIRHALTGETLQLLEKQTLTVVQTSGWLADTTLPGSYSYPITFPLTPANQKFLGYGYRPDGVLPSMEIPVRVELEGVFYRQCTLSYQITDSQGDGYLLIDSGEVYDQLSDRTLRETFTDPLKLGNNGGQTLDQRMNAIAALPAGSFPLTFFPIRNEGFFEDNLGEQLTYTKQAYINAWSGTGFKIDTDTVKGYPAAPQFYLAWVIRTLFEKIGYRVSGDWLGNPEVQRLVIVNLTAMATTATLFTNLYGYTIVPGQYLPDMTVGDFLKAIRTRFGLNFVFNANDKTASIRRFVDVIRFARPTNLSPFQLKNWGINAPDRKGFKIVDYLDPSDALYKDEEGNTINPDPIVLGKGGSTIELKCGTTQLIYTESPQGARWLVPTVRQPGSILDPAYAKSDRAPNKDGSLKYVAGLRLLSFRGMTPDSSGRTYPLATPGVVDGKQEIVGAESCALTGPRGIWTVMLRPYYHFRDNARTARLEARLPIATLSSIKLDEQVQARLGEANLTGFLPSKIEAQAPGVGGKLFTKAEVLTLPAGLELIPTVTPATVWLELIQGAVVVQPQRTGTDGSKYVDWTVSLTVKVWRDRAKTAPAVPVGLRVNVRRLRYLFFTDGQARSIPVATEPVDVYPIGQTVTVIDPRAQKSIRIITGKDTYVETTKQLFQLDPGEGYNII